METSNKLCYWLLFHKDQPLLRRENDTYTIPYGENPPVPVSRTLEVDYRDGFPTRTAGLDIPVEGNDRYTHMGLHASWDYILRACYEKADKAFQLLYWDSYGRFRLVCSTSTVQTTSIMEQCPSYKHEIYSTISTTTIVLIRKEDSILLIHARNSRGALHELVAGFLEAGETLEECVCREIREETGLEVDNITYFGSRPWPYPSNLMVGFAVDYISGGIKLQDEELSSGAFYTKDSLPEILRKLNLARRLIDWWLDHQ